MGTKKKKKKKPLRDEVKIFALCIFNKTKFYNYYGGRL